MCAVRRIAPALSLQRLEVIQAGELPVGHRAQLLEAHVVGDRPGVVPEDAVAAEEVRDGHEPGLIARRLRITPRRPGPHSRKKTDQKAITIGSIQSGVLSTAKRSSCRQNTPRTEKRRHQADRVTFA